jgi:HK97 gp10 family phage protein
MPVDFSQVFRAFDGVAKAATQVEADIKAVARRRATAVQAAARRRLPSRGDTPYATGTMKAHLVVVDDIAHKQFRVEVEETGRDPMIPVYHEFGTVGTPAHPFLRPALDENRDGYLAEAEAAILTRVKVVL